MSIQLFLAFDILAGYSQFETMVIDEKRKLSIYLLFIVYPGLLVAELLYQRSQVGVCDD